MGFFEGLDAEAYDRTYRDRDLVPPHGGLLPSLPAANWPCRSVALVIVSGAGAAAPIVVARGVDLMASSRFARG